MTMIPQLLMFSQDAPHHIPADGKMPGKRPDRPALFGSHDNQSLFQLLPVSDKIGHDCSS